MGELMIDFDSIPVEKIPFQLTELKLEHFYFSDELEPGMPISTSVLLKRNYSNDTDTFDWIKIISHEYIDFSDNLDSKIDSYSVPFSFDIIQKIEKIDLRDFKNNYFTERNPEQFQYWVLSYNHYFKIVGTYDQMFSEIQDIFQLLDFEKIMEQETLKIKEKWYQKFGGSDV